MHVVVMRVFGTSYTLSLAAVGNFPCTSILPRSVNGRIALECGVRCPPGKSMASPYWRRIDSRLIP